MRHRGPGPAARHRTRPPEERSLTPSFIGSFPRADVVLPDPLPEVAFVGRSNVGKSSLLNALVGQRIARVSATPGKTTMLNVFRVEFEKASLYLIDLPGYGYARASHAERGRFRQLIRHAIDRPLLAGVIWLLDIRREPSRDDTSIHEVFAAAGSPILAALTKGDTLARGRRLDRARILGAALSLPPDQVITTSARTREGIPELRQAVAALALQGPTTA